MTATNIRGGHEEQEDVNHRTSMMKAINDDNDPHPHHKIKEKNDGLVAIVIGAGPSGLATALALSNHCQKVYLVEKHATFEKRGATFGMAPNGQKVLNELLSSSSSPERLHRLLQEIAIDTGSSLVFVWWEMRDAFLKCVQECPNIELVCGKEFTEILDQDNSVRVLFGNDIDDDGTTLELKGDFLVAADGVHSKVREIMHLPPLLVSNTTNFRGSLDVPLSTSQGGDAEKSCSNELRGLLDKGIVPLAAENGGDMYFVLFNFNSKKPGRLAWILATQMDVDDTVSPITIARANVQDPDQLRLLEEIFALSEEDHMLPYPKTSIVDLSDEVLETIFTDGGWGGKGRVTFVGDAAHGMRPTDGYGGSMALEDAVVLARILKRALEAQTAQQSIPSMLKEYERERRPRVKRVYDNQWDRYKQRMEQGKRIGPQDPEFLEWLFAGI
jgi:2-polyprenyl-6-methoxyphenol hydroxylase-like FAD-dependent oxidoreductase